MNQIPYSTCEFVSGGVLKYTRIIKLYGYNEEQESEQFCIYALFSILIR